MKVSKDSFNHPMECPCHTSPAFSPRELVEEIPVDTERNTSETKFLKPKLCFRTECLDDVFPENITEKTNSTKFPNTWQLYKQDSQKTFSILTEKENFTTEDNEMLRYKQKGKALIQHYRRQVETDAKQRFDLGSGQGHRVRYFIGPVKEERLKGQKKQLWLCLRSR
uniref:Uncharacterized protein n=1 Tax=Romanomermis culicivorax TaxID=13658 RepID=A0A915I719_ROMCU